MKLLYLVGAERLILPHNEQLISDLNLYLGTNKTLRTHAVMPEVRKHNTGCDMMT
jgi:hypothetical protein